MSRKWFVPPRLSEAADFIIDNWTFELLDAMSDRLAPFHPPEDPMARTLIDTLDYHSLRLKFPVAREGWPQNGGRKEGDHLHLIARSPHAHVRYHQYVTPGEPEGYYAVEFYHTEILHYHADDTVEVRPDGCFTAATLKMLARFCPFAVHKRNHHILVDGLIAWGSPPVRGVPTVNRDGTPIRWADGSSYLWFPASAVRDEWRTGTAIGLAAGTLASKDWGRQAILADALEEAGCDHPRLLRTLRSPGPDHPLGPRHNILPRVLGVAKL